MSQDVTVKFDDGVPITPALMNFYNQCQEWAKRINAITDFPTGSGGGITVKIHVKGMIGPRADFWWRGEDLAMITLDPDGIMRYRLGSLINDWKRVDATKSWSGIFRPALTDVLARKEKQIHDLIDHVENYDWRLTAPGAQS